MKPAQAKLPTGQRARVLGTVAVASLPLLLLGAVSAWRGTADAEASIVEERVTLARAAADLANAYVEDGVSTLQSMALTRDITAPPAEFQTSAFLERVLAVNPKLNFLALYDAEGWNLGVAGAGAPVPPPTSNVADRPHIRRAISEGEVGISPAQIGRIRGVPTVAFSVPVEYQDGTRGALTGTLSFDRLKDELRGLLEESTIRVVIVDAEGQVFVHSDPAIAQALSSARGRPDVDAVINGQVGSRRITEVDGSEVLSAYAPVASTGWGVVLQQPTRLAFEVVNRQLAVALGLLGLAASLTGLVGWQLGDRLSEFYQRQRQARAQAEAVNRELATVSAESEGRRRFLEDMIASAPVAIAVLKGREHRFVSTNQSFQAIKPATPMVGRTLAVALPEIVPQGAIELLDRVFTTGEQFTAADARFDIDDGTGHLEPRYFTMVLSRYDSSDGQPEGVLIIAPETTEAVLARRRSEQEKDEFLSIASHELKTPLTSLALAAQMIDRMLKRGEVDPPRLERHVGTIAVQTSRATQLITELLDVSRIDAGQLELRRGPVDLLALASAAAQRQRDSLPEGASHVLVVTATDEPTVVDGDEARLDQVLTNLLSNAVKYSPEGGRVEIRLACRGANATFTVVDQGIGISAAERDRLFAPFGRTSAARLSGIEGTGLGLYISRRIVDAHGGTIDVEDTPGGGSTFVITLPLHDEAARETVGSANAAAV